MLLCILKSIIMIYTQAIFVILLLFKNIDRRTLKYFVNT